MTVLLDVDHVSVAFRRRRSTIWRSQAPVIAVDDVSLEVGRSSAVGLVGESGSGKSTLARAIAGIVAPTVGEIRLDGRPMTTLRTRADCGRIQMVFQDPQSALNPSRTVERTLTELLLVHTKSATKDEARARAEALLDRVGLRPSILQRRPQALSGGQRQRVGIARAMAVEPDVLVADEAVSALDVSVQAAVINVLRDLRDEVGLALLFITHDLAVVRNLCETTAVMYLGRIVEHGPTNALFEAPQHPYTAALLEARASARSHSRPDRPVIVGEASRTVRRGCRFADRCPIAQPVCRENEPSLVQVQPGHLAACHFAGFSPFDHLADGQQRLTARWLAAPSRDSALHRRLLSRGWSDILE